MIPQCLNYRNLTYDFCFHCPKKGRDLDCPEYLADLEHFKTRNSSSGAVTHTNEETVLRTPSESYSPPFYLGHVDLMRETVLPKVNARMFASRFRNNDRGAI